MVAQQDGDTEAMPPFVESPDNPRTLWQSQDDITGENAIGTRTMPRLSEATQAIGQPDVSATQVIGKQVTSQSDASATQVIAPVDDAETSVLSDTLPNVGSTRAMPTGTQVMPQSMPSTQMLPAQNAWNPAEAPTQVDPTIKPALQRIAMRRHRPSYRRPRWPRRSNRPQCHSRRYPVWMGRTLRKHPIPPM